MMRTSKHSSPRPHWLLWLTLATGLLLTLWLTPSQPQQPMDGRYQSSFELQIADPGGHGGIGG